MINNTVKQRVTTVTVTKRDDKKFGMMVDYHSLVMTDNLSE